MAKHRKAEKIEIRRARATDANLLSVLGAVTFYEAYFEQDDPPDLADYILEAFSLEVIARETENPNVEFYLVFLDGSAVGYAKTRTDTRVDCMTAEKAIELQRIYLVERVFGRGVGERLLNFCLEKARRAGFETLWLGVWRENPRAIRFYEKHGFSRVGTITFPYGSSVGTNLVMEKKL